MIKYLPLLIAIALNASIDESAAAEPFHIVLMIGEEGYHTSETLPEFAEKELQPRGYRISIVNADAVEKNQFPGLIPALHDADLLFLSVRRRTPPKEQLAALRAYLAAGKPLVGIRTACHAFALRPNDKIADSKLAWWQDFDSEVLGCHYTGDYGTGKVMTTVTLAPGANSQAVVQGVDVAKLIGNGGLYKVSPLAGNSTALLMGAIPDHPAEPVAWIHFYGEKQGRIFYTSLGHPDDFKNPEFRRLLVNGIAWALGK